MRITYGTATSNVWQDFRDRLLAQLRNGDRVADLGGGAHPFLDRTEIERLKLRYTVIDISGDELAKAPASNDRVIYDVTSEGSSGVSFETGLAVDLASQFDVAFSVMMAEHIANPEQFHSNVLALLKPGGAALHVFPTLPTLPFIINKLLPEPVTASINRVVSPAKRQERAKFPAYYRWCRGPMTSSIERFERLGWEVVEYRGFYGHPYYDRLPIVRSLHKWKTVLLERYPVASLTNYALVHLRKPITPL